MTSIGRTSAKRNISDIFPTPRAKAEKYIQQQQQLKAAARANREHASSGMEERKSESAREGGRGGRGRGRGHLGPLELGVGNGLELAEAAEAEPRVDAAHGDDEVAHHVTPEVKPRHVRVVEEHVQEALEPGARTVGARGSRQP